MNVILDAFYSLGRKINKASGEVTNETEQGVVSEKLPELKLDMENSALADLTQSWESIWNKSEVKAKWLTQSEDNEKYWLGNHFNRPDGVTKNRPIADNAIFESLETYLPKITRRNPEPMVTLAQSENTGQEQEIKIKEEFTKDLQKTLGDIADELKLRLKLKKSARHWAIYLVGAAKLGWDMNRDMPTVKIVRAKKLILDPDATVDEDGYTGEYIGEYRKLQAGIMIKMLEGIGAEKSAVKLIKDLAKDKLGTEIQFIEWWTAEYMCWTIGKEVLLKKKNPHWNYDSEQPGESTMDDYGVETPGEPVEVKGTNHFPVPKIPFLLLSVFNLGKQPVDDTSLIGQNLSNQDRINKRGKQIDKAADGMNGGVVVSLARSGLTQQQAKGVTKALKDGGVVAIPDGTPDEAIKRMVSPGLPNDVYNDLVDTRRRLSDIFGTSGLSPSGVSKEKTVRGKYQVENMDTDRIGGGITEYLEQFSDDIYNWFVQLLYVYDDKFVAIQGKPKVVISVKEGSLLPKDSTTMANQAIELAGAGKMSVIDLYKKLDYSNPEELAANVWLEVNAPDVLYSGDPRVAQVIKQRQEAAANAPKTEEKPPSQSINFKDLTPDAKIQMLAKVGIVADAEALAAYEETTKLKDAETKRSMTPEKPKALQE